MYSLNDDVISKLHPESKQTNKQPRNGNDWAHGPQVVRGTWFDSRLDAVCVFDWAGNVSRMNPLWVLVGLDRGFRFGSIKAGLAPHTETSD